MNMDKRGGVGFFEAIAGTVAVCLVMTSFLAFVTAEIVVVEDSPSFDWSLMKGLSVVDQRYVWSADGLDVFIDTERIAGITARSSSPGLPVEEMVWMFGSETVNTVKETRVMSVPTDTGTTVPTIVEVFLYR